MAGKGPRGNPVPVADLASAILDPVLRRRTGISIGLVQSWEEIAGPALAVSTRPERIQWARRRDEGDPHEPAVLVVACEGAVALHLQHRADELIARVNAFFGFPAVNRIRIVQKPVGAGTPKPSRQLRPLSEAERKRLAGVTGAVDDEALRTSLERLGVSVLARRSPTT